MNSKDGARTRAAGVDGGGAATTAPHVLFDPARLPPRDEDGWTVHPDLPEWGENEDGTPIFEAMGFEARWKMLEDDDREEAAAAMSRYYEHGEGCAGWNPEPPAGHWNREWTLVAIYDTENGPQATFVRPIAATTSGARDEPRAEETTGAEPK